MQSKNALPKLNSRGFTLVEVLIAVAILVVIFTLAGMVISNQIRTIGKGGQTTKTLYGVQQQVDGQILSPSATSTPVSLGMTLTDQSGRSVTISSDGKKIIQRDSVSGIEIQTFEAVD